MTPTEKLKKYKNEVLDIISKYEPKSFADVLLFGSVAKNEDSDNSDIDLAFRIDGNTFTYSDYTNFYDELETLLGVKVDLVPIHNLKKYVYDDMRTYTVLFKTFVSNL